MKLSKLPLALRERLKKKEVESQPSESEALVHFNPEEQTVKLEHLPREIIQRIGSYLPDPFEACLALSSKTMLYVLGSGSFHRMRTSPSGNEEFTFLAFLSRDLPKYLVCDDCRQLHKGIPIAIPGSYRSFHQSRLIGVRRNTVKILRYAAGKLNLRSGFPLSMTVMALFLFRFNWHQFLHGLHYVQTWYHSSHTRQRRHFFKQIDNAMFMRAQSLILIPWISGTGNSRVAAELPADGDWWLPCDHSISARDRYFLFKALNCQSKNWNWDNCGQHPCGTLYQCQQCMLEYQIHGEDAGEYGLVIVLTAWKFVTICFNDIWTKRTVKPFQGDMDIPIASDESIMREAFERQGVRSSDEDARDSLSWKFLAKKMPGGGEHSHHHVEFDRERTRS